MSTLSAASADGAQGEGVDSVVLTLRGLGGVTSEILIPVTPANLDTQEFDVSSEAGVEQLIGVLETPPVSYDEASLAIVRELIEQLNAEGHELVNADVRTLESFIAILRSDGFDRIAGEVSSHLDRVRSGEGTAEGVVALFRHDIASERLAERFPGARVNELMQIVGYSFLAVHSNGSDREAGASEERIERLARLRAILPNFVENAQTREMLERAIDVGVSQLQNNGRVEESSASELGRFVEFRNAQIQGAQQRIQRVGDAARLEGVTDPLHLIMTVMANNFWETD